MVQHPKHNHLDLSKTQVVGVKLAVDLECQWSSITHLNCFHLLVPSFLFTSSSNGSGIKKIILNEAKRTATNAQNNLVPFWAWALPWVGVVAPLILSALLRECQGVSLAPQNTLSTIRFKVIPRYLYVYTLTLVAVMYALSFDGKCTFCDQKWKNKRNY